MAKDARCRVSALDGLKGLAIAGVIAYHAWPGVVPGGFLGVTVFFVLTGYLITRSVVRGLDGGSFSYPRYLGRRVSRIAPPTWALIGVMVVLTAWLAPNLLPKVHADALPAALFASNWAYVLRNVSYFAAAGLPSPLTHLWYLGVVMQFYLTWPIMLLLLRGLTDNRRPVMAVVTALLVVASAVAMGVLFDPLADTARVYYGTDTRLGELLCGAVAALVPSRRQGSHERPREHKGGALLSVACLAYAVAFIALLFVVDGTWDVLYRGGYLVLAVLTALVVRTLASGRARAAGTALGCRPLASVGRRSLQLYLWHYPLLILLNPANRTTALPWWGWLLELALIVVAAEVAHRLFEVGGHVRKAGVALAVAGIVVAVGITYAPLDWDALTAEATGNAGEQVGQTELVETAETTVTEPSSEADGQDEDGSAATDEAAVPQDDGVLTPDAEKVPANLDTSGWTYDPATGVCDANVLIIGDSVTLGAKAAIEAVLPDAYVDAEVSRQLYVGQDVYAADVAAGHDAPVVIVALGGNSLIRDEGNVQTVIDAVGGKPLYFVTIRCPYPLQDINNEILRRFASENDNVGIIDWYGDTVGHDDWLVSDGQHLTTAGTEAYALLIRRALCGM